MICVTMFKSNFLLAISTYEINNFNFYCKQILIPVAINKVSQKSMRAIDFFSNSLLRLTREVNHSSGKPAKAGLHP